MSDKFEATFHPAGQIVSVEARNATETDERVSRALPDADGAAEALVQQIAEAIGQVLKCKPYDGPWNALNRPVCDRHGGEMWTEAGCPVSVEAARAVLPLVEAQVAPLRDERDRLKRGGKELGRVLDRTLRDALDASGRHDAIDEDGDGDWGVVWETLAELRPRAERAEAEVERLTRDALAEAEAYRAVFARAEKAEARLRVRGTSLEADLRQANLWSWELKDAAEAAESALRQVREDLRAITDPDVMWRCSTCGWVADEKTIVTVLWPDACRTFGMVCPECLADGSFVDHDPMIEQLAADVHEAWMQTKREQGITSRPAESGEEQMVPYADLSEPVKDLDRGTVNAVLAALRPVLARVGTADTQPEGVGEAECGCGSTTCGSCGYCRGSEACHENTTPTAGGKVDTAPEADCAEGVDLHPGMTHAEYEAEEGR